jgi:8-oxo-dGTP diphosphatase
MKSTHALSVAVKAVIVRRNRVLMLRRHANDKMDAGLWDIPGGRMLFGEKPLDALRREIAEETGLALSGEGVPISVWSFMATEKHQVLGVTLFCRCRRGAVRLSAEHSEYKWAASSDIDKLPMHPSLRAELRAFLCGSTVLRPIPGALSKKRPRDRLRHCSR